MLPAQMRHLSLAFLALTHFFLSLLSQPAHRTLISNSKPPLPKANSAPSFANSFLGTYVLRGAQVQPDSQTLLPDIFMPHGCPQTPSSHQGRRVNSRGAALRTRKSKCGAEPRVELGALGWDGCDAQPLLMLPQTHMFVSMSRVGMPQLAAQYILQHGAITSSHSRCQMGCGERSTVLLPCSNAVPAAKPASCT